MVKKLALFFVALNFISCTEKSLDLSQNEEFAIAQETYFPTQEEKTQDLEAITFIKENLQNKSSESLKKTMNTYGADFGCIVIMEVHTGEIHAMVNLEKSQKGDFTNISNTAVNHYFEPGSLMKTFDAMALLEDGKSKISTLYPSSNGKITLFGRTITDAKEGGFGDLSLGNALAYSSNTIFAQALTNAYIKDPSVFVTRLKNCFNLSALNLPFEVKSNPYFPRVNSPEWSESTLAQLAIGYGLKLSPIQILTYYNALANNGTLVQPKFISLIKNKKGNKKYFTKSKVHSKICSSQTANKIKNYLRKSLVKGNGQSFNSNNIAIAGKTTLTTLYKNHLPQKYLAGFAGYFPHSNPKYSIIALVGNLRLPFPNIAGNLVKDVAETTIN